MKKLIYIILILLMSIVLIFSIYSSFNLSFFGFRIYKIGSGSMMPYLNINDLIIIKESNNYNVNDVITYNNNDGSTTTHRIISMSSNEIITKGDANNTEDLPISKDKIIGKLVFRIHNIGFINYLLSKPLFWFILFILGFVITIIIPDNKSIERS